VDIDRDGALDDTKNPLSQETAMSLIRHIEVPFHERHDDELLTLDEVAEILRTPENTLRWWRQTGVGPTYFKIGRRLHITVGDLRSFIRDQRLASQSLVSGQRRY
jgi:hypothetical protein